jgi:hypothetical protein
VPGPDTAVEEAPVLAGLYLAVEFFLLWIMYRALKGVWRLVFSPMLEGIANSVKINVWRVHLNPGGVITDIDHRIINFLGEQALASEQAMGYWFHQAARLQMWIVNETWALARDTFHFGEWIVKKYGPLLVTTATTVAFPWPKIIRAVDSAISAALAKSVKLAHGIAHEAASVSIPKVTIPYLGELDWLHKHWRALIAALAAAGSIAVAPGLAIPKVWRGIDELLHSRSITNRRLSRLEGLLGATALAAAMANVLGLRSARCLRSGNLGRLSRAVCGFDSSLLSSLLGLTAAVGGTLSIVELAEANQRILPGVIDGLGFLVDETPDAFREVGDDALALAASLIPGV